MRVPLIWALGTSLRAADNALGTGWLWLPGAPTLENYKRSVENTRRFQPTISTRLSSC